MLSAGTKELKDHLGRFLLRVRNGEDVLITVHGKPVARIVKEPSRSVSLRDRLATLVANGLIEFPKGSLRKHCPEPAEIGGRPLSEIVIEERR